MSTKEHPSGEFEAGEPRDDKPAHLEVSPRLYEELRRLARKQAGGSGSIQPTVLAHEAYLKLAGAEVDYRGRTHFLAVASRAMRMVVIDTLRAAGRAKRGGGGQQATLDEGMAVQERSETLLELDDVLSRLEAQDERKARIVEMHYFGGLSYGEIAVEMGLSEATVDRELRMAKAWLKSALGRSKEPG